MRTSYAPPPPDTTPRYDLLRKILARALDPAAPEPEALTSAAKFVTVARRDGLGYADVGRIFAPALPPPGPEALGREMPFGKYAGRSLRDIYRVNPGYLRWAAAELDDEELREAAQAVLKHFEKGGRR